MIKIIVRVKGGLGNQLFHYAFAKRLSIYNNCKLVIDNITSFKKYDYIYNRKYSLDNFLINDKLADKSERLEPFEKIRRNILTYYSKFKSFENKLIYNSEFLEFDKRFLNLIIKKSIILDGNWQSEYYFKDIEDVIRKNLLFRNYEILKNNKYFKGIKFKNSVGIHLRSHGYKNPVIDSQFNADKEYYSKSIEYIKQRIQDPHFYIFSDDRTNIKEFINLFDISYTLVKNKDSYKDPIIDFFLLSNCKYFIIAASTFSWWAAWLSKNKDKIVISPNVIQTKMNKTSAWGFKGLIPKEWIVI